MRGRSGVAAVLVLLLGSAAVRAAEPSRPTILVHDMPWFESKPVSGRWGWHWTMNHIDPERSDASGKREIAAHQYPIIGPYDSADPDVLEYHTLLMKVAGIDGVIADWYGSEDVNDYAMIHRRTAALFDAAGRRGLKFALCYEDRVLKLMDAGSAARAVEHGRAHLRSCADDWFRRPSYLTWEGRPLLLNFGPEYLKPEQWEAIFAGMHPSPSFFTLHERRPPAIGRFAWPPMWASKNGVLDAQALDAYLDRFYAQPGPAIGAAFPGFHDFYQEAGVAPTHGVLDDRDGATFRHTLDRALASGVAMIQVVTWNDFGEGTAVEPTREHGYRDLEAIQDARRKSPDDPFPFRPDDLRLPLRIYHLRKTIAPTSPSRKALDEAADRLNAGDMTRASKRIAELEAAALRPPSRPR